MTSANVSNIMQAQNLVTKVSKLSDEIGTSVDFSKMLVQNSDNAQKYEFKASEVATNLPGASSSIDFEKQQPQSMASKSKVSTADKKTEISDEEKAALEETAKELDSEIKKAIADTMDVTEEEVEDAMEAMGLSVMDILDTSNLAKLLTELTGNEDVTNVLLSEAFTEIKTEITQIFADFANQSDMPIDDFSQVMTELLDTEVMPEDIPNLDEAGPIKGASEDAIASEVVDTIESTQITQHVTKTDSEGNVEVEETAADGKETITVVNQAKPETSSDTKNDNNSSDEKNSGDKEKVATAHEHTVINAQVEGNTSFEVNPVQTEVPNYTPQINPQELIEQLVEKTKASFTNQETSIEMILNPEELGKLMLKVAEDKSGHMTASIIVQNEDVKEALVQQMTLLKDNLNEQGVKIEAIEVTVSAHEFEENLENQFSGEEKQGEEAERQANVRRNINLNDLDSLSGIMSEEEMLVAQMMADQGNTVNLTA